MNYIVYLKQVPLSTTVKIDPVTKTLLRSSALTQTNPDDLYALEEAVALKRKTGADVIAVSMGPSSAESVLKEALQRGADKAILISDKAFAGSDTWCTSLVLSAVARKIGDYTILFFGKMAIDGDTAQVGPEVAAQLNIPQVTLLQSIDKIDHDEVFVTRNTESCVLRQRIKLPCAIMVSKGVCELKAPNLKGWRWANSQQIERWDATALNLNPNDVGLNASPTQVVSTNVPDREKQIVWLKSKHDLEECLSLSFNKSKTDGRE